jgi:hypothetical protein
MSIRDIHVEVAILNRIADLLDDGFDLSVALRITSKNLKGYYDEHIHEKVVPFDLTAWARDKDNQ